MARRRETNVFSLSLLDCITCGFGALILFHMIVASRAEGSIVDDLVTPADEAARMKAQRAVLSGMIEALEGASPGVRRVLGEESGIDFTELIREGHQVLNR